MVVLMNDGRRVNKSRFLEIRQHIVLERQPGEEVAFRDLLVVLVVVFCACCHVDNRHLLPT